MSIQGAFVRLFHAKPSQQITSYLDYPNRSLGSRRAAYMYSLISTVLSTRDRDATKRRTDRARALGVGRLCGGVFAYVYRAFDVRSQTYAAPGCDDPAGDTKQNATCPVRPCHCRFSLFREDK